jgi:hypothetical protein
LVELHDLKPDAEEPEAFRRIQFGKTKTSAQPKSRLHEWASWLLQ